MIPYDASTIRVMKANNAEVDRFAALEFSRANREWAAAAARSARQGKRRARWMAAILAYLSPR